MTCQELVELVTEYFDGALPEMERARFEAHLAECPACELYLAQMRTTIEVVGAAPWLAERPEVSALLATFRDWRRSA
jgi:anti-sigma factor RsiW